MSFPGSNSYKIGVDGGGTKTECILVDPRGEIVARQTFPGCNPSQTGPERARAILLGALGALTAARPSSVVGSCLFCMAGSRAFWNETAAGLKGFGMVTATDDSVPVLELATGGGPGLVLHAGTGSFVAARSPDGRVHYAGGLGWRFGDPGSAHDLGRRAIARALLELQGWRKPTRLGDALRAHTDLAEAGAVTRLFYHGSEANAKISSFAPRVIELAAQDDAAARDIVIESLAGLGDLVDGVLARLFPASRLPPSVSPPAPLAPPPPLGVSGPILNSPPAVAALRKLAGVRGWRVGLRFITDPPVEGIRRLLMKGG
ncbi:MAG: BadF/BadG/BcrA/BcrD ATPase family protein [Opitutaceae bacterium]|nr:BadF/BadG/BcrA/BcrD ATPase family protein [Opitutaceae bacterium]